jgi:acyl-CoA synthetase (AMP-forming)/AMP-acid ligase II
VDGVIAGLVAPAARPIIPGGGPQTVAAVLEPGLRAHPGHEALVGRHRRYTYAELDDEVEAAAGALHGLGVRTGERVAMSVANHPEIVVGFLACMRLGAIWVGVNLALARPEKVYLLRDAEVAVLVAEPRVVDELALGQADLPDLRHVVTCDPAHGPRDEWHGLLDRTNLPTRPRDPVDPFAPAAIAYTSGTTGFPKGAVHSQHNLLLPGAVARARAQYDENSRIGVCLPLTILNLIALGPLVAFQCAATCVTIDRIDPVGLATWIRDERISACSTVPAILHGLLTHPDVTEADLATLSAPGVGGADCPDHFRELYRARFGTEVTVGYGLTEAPTAVTMTDPADPPVPGSSGRALPHVRVVVLDDDGRELPPGEVGELCVAPRLEGDWAGVYTPMLGYWRRPEATAEALRDGVLHTGDLGYVDAHGEVFVKDRRHDVIIRGGANVYPAEVERVVHDDPRVAACAVVGKPDDRLGERVVAFVEVAPGRSVTSEELVDYCRTQLAAYKVPEEWHFVETMPRNAMNKILKHELRARLRPSA